MEWYEHLLWMGVGALAYIAAKAIFKSFKGRG